MSHPPTTRMLRASWCWSHQDAALQGCDHNKESSHLPTNLPFSSSLVPTRGAAEDALPAEPFNTAGFGLRRAWNWIPLFLMGYFGEVSCFVGRYF